MTISADQSSLDPSGDVFLSDQWGPLVRVVQNLGALTGIDTEGTAPDNILTGIRFGLDGQSINANDWRLSTETIDAISIQENTGTESVPVWTSRMSVEAGGFVGIGTTNPVEAFQVDGNGLFSTTSAVTSVTIDADTEARLHFSNSGVDEWRLDNSGSAFRLIYEPTTQTTVVIEPTAPSNAVYVDADGHVGLGINPSTFAFLKTGAGTTWKFASTDDAGGFFQIQGGTAAGSEREVSYDLLDKSGVMQWRWTKSNADPASLFLRPKGAATNTIVIEPQPPANSLYIDSDGHVGLGTDPTASFGLAVTAGNIWYFHNQANASSSLRMGAGSTIEQIFDLIWVDASGTGTPNTIQWRIRKESSNRMVFFDSVASSPFIIEQSAVIGDSSSAIVIDALGSVGFGTPAPDADAALHVVNTEKVVVFPRTANDTNRPAAPPIGSVIYNDSSGTAGFLEYYDGTNWRNVHDNTVA